MRVVHITNCLLAGGIQNFLASLLPEQVKAGWDVSIITIEEHTADYCHILEDKMVERGVKAYNLHKKRSNKISFLHTIVQCRKLIKKLAPDVVNTHGSMAHVYGDYATRFTSIAHVLTVHNAPERWDILCKLLNNSKPLIYCSHSAYDLRVQPNKNIIAIDNGISTEITKSPNNVDLRSELGLPPEAKIVLSVGSLRLQKNYELLKEISQALGDSNIHFCVCGGSYGPGYMSTESFRQFKNIHFLGLRSDVSAIENASDLFLSCATFEGLPIAVLEAFFNGIPCVLSPIPQHKAIAGGVADCIIPETFDATSFAHAIRMSLSKPHSHEEIYQKRLPVIEQFSISTTAKKYLAFYQSNLKL